MEPLLLPTCIIAAIASYFVGYAHATHLSNIHLKKVEGENSVLERNNDFLRDQLTAKANVRQ